MGKLDQVLVDYLRYYFSHSDIILAPSSKPSSIGPSPVEAFPTSPSSYIYLKPQKIDYHCLHRIFSALSDSLNDIYYEYKSAKELWIPLENEYGLNDTEVEIFTSSSFNKFMMTASKPINDQLHKFQDYI